MTDLEKAARMALEVLKYLQPTAMTSFYTIGDRDKAITALRTAIAEAEKQEPVAWNSGVLPLHPQPKDDETISAEYAPLGYWNAVQGWVELPEETHTPTAWVYPEALEAFRQGKPWTAYGLNGEGFDGSDGVKRIPLYTTPPPAPVQDSDHEFKNFHRQLCERFSYTHDEVDWKRDQISLIEWIDKQKKSAELVQEPTIEDNSQDWDDMDGATAWHLIYRHADGWADVGKMMDEWRKANTTPPAAQRQWVGLTVDEVYDMYNEPRSDAEMLEFARAIEAKLKEKNIK